MISEKAKKERRFVFEEREKRKERKGKGTLRVAEKGWAH